MKKYLTLCKYVDYSIYNILDDLSLLRLSLTCKKYYQSCHNEEYWKYRTIIYYGNEVCNNKPISINYKQQYKDLVHVLYKRGFIGNNSLDGRIDIILAATYIYNFIPESLNIRCIFAHGMIDSFEKLCISYEYDRKCLIRSFIAELLKNGQTNMLKYVIDKYKIYPDQSIIDEACKYNNLELFKYLKSIGLEPSVHGFNYAVKHSNVYVYQWIIDQIKISPSHLTLEYAIKGQQSNIVRWILSIVKPLPNIINLAVSHGNVDILILILNMYDFKPNIKSINIALKRNSLPILIYLWDNLKLKPDTDDVHYNCCNFESLKWYCETFDEVLCQETINKSSKYGYLKIIEYAYENYELLPEYRYIDLAAINGHYDIIQWLYKININMDFSNCIDEISICGHLNLLKFIYEKYKIKPNRRFKSDILENGSIHIINWINSVEKNQ